MTISLFATKSMKAIDDWLKVAQSNLTGSTRTAFKESIIMYLGGVTSIDRNPTNKEYGKMMAEQALNTGYTRLDWRQGEIISSTQDTHFAINGEGFFLVVDPRGFQHVTGSNPSAIEFDGSNTSPNDSVYLTRDGEFTWRDGSDIIISGGGTLTAGVLYLVTKEGLLVMGDIGAFQGGGYSDNIYRTITKDEFDSIEDTAQPSLPYRVRPSIVQPTGENPNKLAPNTAFDYDMLRFSKYGSTIFKTEGVTSIKTIVNGTSKVLDSRDPGGPNLRSKLVEKALEASNTDTAANVTEMAILGKVYNGFVQLIKVYNSALDEVLSYIR